MHSSRPKRLILRHLAARHVCISLPQVAERDPRDCMRHRMRQPLMSTTHGLSEATLGYSTQGCSTTHVRHGAVAPASGPEELCAYWALPYATQLKPFILDIRLQC